MKLYQIHQIQFWALNLEQIRYIQTLKFLRRLKTNISEAAQSLNIL
jgi:hypothetical protein